MRASTWVIAFLLLFGSTAVYGAETSPWQTIVVGKQSTAEQLATVDLQRYIAQVTGQVPRIEFEGWRFAERGNNPALFLGTPESSPEVKIRAMLLSEGLGEEGFFLHDLAGRIVAGGLTERGAVNAIYGLLRELGFGFYLGSEAVPDELPGGLSSPLIVRKPALRVRGVLPWYNFFNSPTTWDPVDHRAFVDQLIRMGANFVGFHTYDYEPFAAYEEDGKMKWGRRLLNTASPTWGTHPLPTGRFAFGTNLLFADEFFGAATSYQAIAADEAIRREQAIMRDALDYAKKRGLHTCLGFEIPGDPTRPADREVFLERLNRVLDQYPALDYVWIWQVETQGAQGFRANYKMAMLPSKLESGSALPKYGQARRDVFKRVVERKTGEPPFFQDNEDGKVARAIEGARLEQFAQLAYRALARRQNPPKLIVSGWGGDERLLSAEYYEGLDKLLPADVVFASLDHIVPRPRVDRVYHELSSQRQRWPIPWLEYDGDQWHPQPYVHVYESLFKDLLQSGSQGVLGIHWRTREVEENFGYLVAAAWQPDLTAEAFFADLARRCYPAQIAPAMGHIHLELDALGYRWVGGNGQGECGPFTWGPGDPAKAAQLRKIRERVAALLPQAGRSASRVQWIIDRIDWVLAFQQAEESAVAARDLLARAQSSPPEEAKKLAAEALARLDDGAMSRALQAYARRVTTRGEYGVLATINTKAVVAWRELREQAGRVLGEKAPEPASDISGSSRVIVPRFYGSVPAGRALQIDVIGDFLSGEFIPRYRRLGQTDTKPISILPLDGDVHRLKIPAADVVSPGLEISINGLVPGSSRSFTITVMPDLPVDTTPRPRLASESATANLQVRQSEGARLPIELSWDPMLDADYFKVYRDGQLLAETAVPFVADAPGKLEAVYTVEAWRDDKRLSASEPIVVHTPDHAITEKPSLAATVNNVGVILRWPAAGDAHVLSYMLSRGRAGEPVEKQVTVARITASLLSEHVFRDRPDPGEWAYRLVPMNGADRPGPAGEVTVPYAPRGDIAPVLALPLTEKPMAAKVVGDVQFTSEGARLDRGHLVLPADEAFSLADPMTLCFEFKADSTAEIPVLLCSGQWQIDGWFAQILGDALVIRTSGADAQGPRIQTGKWYAVQFVFDGSQLELYVDGKPAGEPTSARPVPGGRNLIIGQYDQPEARYAFRGVIRNLRVYADVVLP